MTAALWVLAGAVVLLASVIFACFLAWEAGAGNRLEVLDDDEIYRRCGPYVAWSRQNNGHAHDDDHDN